jgi:GntR family transcriptional regulator
MRDLTEIDSCEHAGSLESPNMAENRREPAYLKIERYLQSLILEGAGRSEPLPPEPELAEKFEVSRMTARQAYQRLANAGVITRRRGAGSFVTGHFLEELPIEGVPDFSGWIDQAETDRRIHAYALVAAPADVARAFGLKSGAKVTLVQRERTINGVPSLDLRYMPAAVHRKIRQDEFAKASILQLLAQAGLRIAAGQVEIDAHKASADEAKRLHIEPGDPVLERRLIYRDDAGNGVLMGTSLYPGGKAYTFRFQFNADLVDAL